MSEIKAVNVLLADGTIIPCEIRVANAVPGRLVFSGLGMKDFEFEEKDLFEALRSLRAHLERMGCKVLCAGARIDVFPSGMSRDMGGGRKAYITRLGIPATEVIDILDEASSELVGTVSQQTEYHNKWILSLTP